MLHASFLLSHWPRPHARMRGALNTHACALTCAVSSELGFLHGIRFVGVAWKNRRTHVHDIRCGRSPRVGPGWGVYDDLRRPLVDGHPRMRVEGAVKTSAWVVVATSPPLPSIITRGSEREREDQPSCVCVCGGALMVHWFPASLLIARSHASSHAPKWMSVRVCVCVARIPGSSKLYWFPLSSSSPAVCAPTLSM